MTTLELIYSALGGAGAAVFLGAVVVALTNRPPGPDPKASTVEIPGDPPESHEKTTGGATPATP